MTDRDRFIALFRRRICHLYALGRIEDAMTKMSELRAYRHASGK